MKPDTQKTTKAVREAPVEPQGCRYELQLTLEGWQIKDREKGKIRADTFGSYESAAHECAALNAAS